MKIGPVDHGGRPVRPEDEHRREEQTCSADQRDTRPKDSVEISPAGQSLLEESRSPGVTETQAMPEPGPAELADLLSAYVDDPKGSEIRQDKVDQARERAKSGYYDKPEVKEEIARRMTDDFLG